MAVSPTRLAQPSTVADTASFSVILRDINMFDPFGSRRFHLLMNSTVSIGRASKNSSKKELLPSPQNAFIDSPVISRDHAILSANASSGKPCIYISDRGSMHGTLLNGRRLLSGRPEPLSTGDVLQFGVDVSRNEEHFVARRYVFETDLSSSFSQGFTVPDAESEDEQDFTMQDHSRVQQDSQTIDMSETELEHTSCGEQKAALVDNIKSEQAEHVLLVEKRHSYEPDLLSGESSSSSESDYLDEGNNVTDCLADSDDEDQELHTTDREASSDESEASKYDSELEMLDSEDDGLELSSPESVSACEAQLPVGLSLPLASNIDIEDVANIQAESTPFDTFSRPFQKSAFVLDSMPVQLPSARAFLETMTWDSPPPPVHVPLPVSQSEDVLAWHGSKAVGAEFNDLGQFKAGSCAISSNSGLRSPPPSSNSDIRRATSPQPGRRTRVSIDEIVEDQSVMPVSSNSLKRKADVLDKDEQAAVLDRTLVPEEANKTETAIHMITASDAISQRPKKQPRSIVRRTLSKATYPLLGAAGAIASFTLLSTLPDAFFGA